jgi:Xaa-Pro aminopeptidase
MDVHDVGRYHVAGKPRPLEPGMVLTVEPGLYFPAQDDAVPEGLRATGIRIEDDILVTEAGYLNLSGEIPKLPAELEDIMQRGRGAAVR